MPVENKLSVTVMREPNVTGKPPKKVELYFEEGPNGTKVLAKVNGSIFYLIDFQNCGKVYAYEYCSCTGFDVDDQGRILFSHFNP
jgi:hypothetical protein